MDWYNTMHFKAQRQGASKVYRMTVSLEAGV